MKISITHGHQATTYSNDLSVNILISSVENSQHECNPIPKKGVTRGSFMNGMLG